MRYQAKSTCFISVFAILLLCCFTSPLFAQTELLPTSDFKNDTQSTLTIAMSEDLLPLSFFNADGRPAGLFVDIWRLWAEKTGRKIAFRLTSWAETMKALKLGEVDIHSGLFEAENRAAWIRFSQPIYGVGIRIFFPLKRGSILTLRELVGKKVGVTRGSHVEGYVRERYPEVDVVAFRSMKEAIYATREGAIAAFVGVDPVISGILVRLGLQGEFDSAPEALYKRTFHAGVLKENVELLNVIDKGFDAISTSEVAKTEARWIPEPQKQYFKSGEKKLRLTPEERAWLVKHPKIDVGIMNNWPPMNYVDKKGIPRGIGVDYLDAINTQLGDVLNIIPAPFKENYDAVQAKRLDALMDITPKPDREPFFNFTKPYLTIPQIIVGQKNTTYLYGEKDLYGKTVALEHGYYTITRFKRDHPEIKIREYNSTSDCLDAVARGEVDAYVGNRAVAIYLIEKELIANLQTMGRTSEKPVPLVIGTRKDFPELAVILDKALASLSPQTIQDIHRKWAKRTDPMAKALVLTPEERAWLTEHPVITLTTLPNWQPFVITDDKTGELTGIDVEFIKLLNQRLGGAIKIETYDWKTLVQMSKDHKVDGFFPASITEDRKPYLVWTQVYNSTPLALVTLRDAPDIKEWRDLAGKKVVMTASSSYIELLGELAPKAEIVIVKNVEEQVPFLAEGKADAVLNSAPVLYHTMRSNNVLTLMRFQKYYMSDNHGQFRIAIRNDKPLLLSILNKGIASITEEEFNAIKSKWIPIEVLAGSPLKAAVELTEEEQAWIKAHPVIRLGGGIFPPLGGLDSAGEVEGIGRAYADLIAGRLGIRFEHSAGVWADVHEQAKRREIDGIRLLIPNEERDAYLNFTNAYTELGYGLVTHQSAKPVYALTELTGMRLAALKASYDHNLVAKQHPDIDLLSVDSYEAGIDAVFNRKADAFIGALAPIEYIIQHKAVPSLRVTSLVQQWSSPKIVLGIREDWPELIPILNKAIQSITAQEHAAIARVWQAVDTVRWKAVSIRDQLNEEEKAWLDQNHTVRVRIVDWPPYQIVKDNGPPQGIVIEYLKLIGERTGIAFKYEVADQPFAEFLGSMKQRQGPDMTAVIVPTPDRDQYLSFSETYLSSPYVIFIREQEKPILDISDLTGKTLAVPRGFVVQEQLDRDYPGIRQALFDSDEKALQAVATGKADAYIGNLTVASHIIHTRGFSHLKVAAAGPFGDQALSMGNRKDWPELTSIIDKALASITEEEKTAIRNKFLAIKFEQGIDKVEVLKWFLSVGGVVLGIVIIILFWNRRLSREIIKRKQTEEDLKRARDEADAANRAKSTFLANMSHELRTPLNAILGFSGVLARERNTTSDQQEKLSIINRSGQHLLSMINDVLDLSKIEAERIELQEHPFDLVALIKEISVMIQSRVVEKGLSIVVEAETVSFSYVKADSGKLRQILVNLLGNAVKFTDEGGVTIRCATDPMPEEPNRCHIVIEVEDTGPGIDPARQAKIFEPFVQGIDEPVRKGTGLGLSICKAYADLMGGTLEVESELCKGSLFRLRLPAEIDDAADIKSPVDDKPRVIGLAPTDKTWRILVADDNRENLLLLKSLLESVGFFVLEAKNGKEAVEAFKKESLDLIWMDMRMPVMDGYEAVRQIRQCSGGDTVPIIAITASAFREQRHEILATGCDDMVTKPFQAHEIFETMGRQLSVKYIYQDWDAEAAQILGINLTAEMLAELPLELNQELRQAVLELDREAIFAVIERIEPLAPDTAKGLRILLDNFQTGLIGDLLGENDEK